jgi:hypothetical protein
LHAPLMAPARPARSATQGDRPDRRGDRPRIFLRIAGSGG